jgi:hypothetical protein
MTCLHEDLVAVCPFGCGEGTVDADTQMCSSCHEHAIAVMVCAYCEDEIPERDVPRVIPPHAHVWVDDGRYTDTGDVRQRCVGCPAVRDLMPWQQREQDDPSLAGETQAEWTRRMMRA